MNLVLSLFLLRKIHQYHVDIYVWFVQQIRKYCVLCFWQVLDKYNPPDHFLPESYTCFFLLKLPRYSCKQVLEEKLKYAIHFCKSIDTDDYARIALTGEPAADDSSDDSDNEDADSFASDSTQDYLTGH